MPFLFLSLRRITQVILCCSCCAFALSNFAAEFGSGSHEVFHEQMGKSFTLRYDEIVSGYSDWCESNPEDVTAAVERSRFIGLFLYSEDYFIEGVEDDYDGSILYLEERFEGHPKVVLLQLEDKFGEEFFEEAEDRLLNSDRWNSEDKAALLGMLAERRSWEGDDEKAEVFAGQSFKLYPKKETGLMLAELQLSSGHLEDSLETIGNPAISALDAWEKKRKMDLLLELGESQEVVVLYHELKDSEEVYMGIEDRVKFLLSQGEIDLAREEFSAMEVSEWNRTNLLKQRFEFELEHGNLEQANAAYTEYRDLGYGRDSLLKHRFALHAAFPGANWRIRDFLGILALVAYLGIVALAPLILIVPVHYWSLIRQRSGKTTEWGISPWGLKSVWLVFGSILVCWCGGAWYWDGEAWQAYFLDEYFVGGEIEGEHIFEMQILDSVVMALFMAAYYWKDRALGLLRTNVWSVGKSLGIVFLCFVSFRVLAGLHVAVFPEIQGGGVSQGTPLIDELMLSLWTEFGFWGLLFFIGLLGPILEELLFRGMLLGALAKHVPIVAANLIQAVFFALMHENYLLFGFYVGFGFTCGVLLRKSGGLLPCIAFHILNNSLVCVAYAIRFASE